MSPYRGTLCPSLRQHAATSQRPYRGTLNQGVREPPKPRERETEGPVAGGEVKEQWLMDLAKVRLAELEKKGILPKGKG